MVGVVVIVLTKKSLNASLSVNNFLVDLFLYPLHSSWVIKSELGLGALAFSCTLLIAVLAVENAKSSIASIPLDSNVSIALSAILAPSSTNKESSTGQYTYVSLCKLFPFKS